MKRLMSFAPMLVLLGALCWPPQAEAAPSVGEWSFDEGSGTTAADASGNGHDGTLVNGLLWTAGKLGQGLSFDGLDDRVDVAHAAGLNAFPLTVAAWFKTSSTSGVRGIVNKYVAGSYNGYNLFLNDGNLCAWYLRDDLNFVYDGSGCTFGVAGYNDGQWHQAIYVVDESGARLYVDGVEKGSLGWTGVAGEVTTTEPVHVGYYPGAFGGAEYFDGAADEVRIYQGSFSAAQVAALQDGTVRYVDNLGTCAGRVPCYPTIMDAVTAAAAFDTIEVFPGVYHGTVAFSSKSDIVLRAHQAQLKPVIVASPGGHAITVTWSSGTQIINLVLEAPEGTGVWAAAGPPSHSLVIVGNLIKSLHGINAYNSGACTVRNNTLLGGSIVFRENVSGCLVEGNRTSSGRISLSGSYNTHGTVVRDNVLQGGGISIGGERANRNRIQSNRVYGGDIGVVGPIFGADSNVIEDNVVRGGGIRLEREGSSTIKSNFVSGSAGDGIWVRGGHHLIRENTSVENAGCDLNEASYATSDNRWEQNRFGTKCGAVD